MPSDSAEALPWPDITMVKLGIHNPADPRHFMRIKPIANTVQILLGDESIAKSQRALRLLEVGGDLYDPVIYVPRADISESFEASDTTTFCPLKGTASYLSLAGDEDGKDLAWTYSEPFDFAAPLKGYVAFYTNRVSIRETPL